MHMAWKCFYTLQTCEERLPGTDKVRADTKYDDGGDDDYRGDDDCHHDDDDDDDDDDVGDDDDDDLIRNVFNFNWFYQLCC